MGTVTLLESKGIKSYFSSCLTTTLNEKYLDRNSFKDKVIFVDPYYPVAGTRSSLFNMRMYFRDLYLLFKHRKTVSRFVDRFENEYWTWYGRISRRLEKRICASVFYEYYSRIVDRETLLNAEYITHNIPSSQYNTHEGWMNAAKDLIRRYARAKYVITSRIHCALPCLGVETPVIFVTSDALDNGMIRNAGRFGGLLDLLNVVRFGRVFKPVSPGMVSLFKAGKLSDKIEFSNPSDYKVFRDDLVSRVRSFLNNN